MRRASIVFCICVVLPTTHLLRAEEPLVQISVEVVEVDSQKSQKLGVRWFDTVRMEEAQVPAVFSIGPLTRGKIFGDLQMLIDEGAADLLANPKLVTRSGTTAFFHAGGEIPYIVSGNLGSSNVEFKSYGVGLEILPAVHEEKHIRVDLKAEVSAPDEHSSASVQGNTVPGILSRRVENRLTLESGATLTIAGLLQTQKQVRTERVPLLSHIPVLGVFFSRKTTSFRKTSIVIFVTPQILKPEAS